MPASAASAINKRSERHRDGQQVEADEASLLLLLVGDVERGDHRCGAVGPAIGCDEEGEQDPQSLGLLRRPDRVHQLVADEEGDVGRKHRGQRPHVLDHGERIGGEAVNEDDQPEQRKKRKEAVESDPGRDQRDIVVPHPLVGALDDVLPRGFRHLPRANPLDVPSDRSFAAKLKPIDPCSRNRPGYCRYEPLLPTAKNRRTVEVSRRRPSAFSERLARPSTARRESRMAGQPSKGTRVIALVGPAGAGKTSLAEAMLFAAGATDRLGSTANGSSIGDSSPEARQRGGSTELNLYNFNYLGDDFAILDVPGSVGFAADGAKALAIADVAIVVVDPDPARAPLAAPALRALDELGIPHLIFVNRIDQAHGRIRDLLSALQPMSVSPLIARQIPIWDGEKIGGFVDLALEYAFKYRAGQAVRADRDPRRPSGPRARGPHPHARAARRP